MDKDTLLNDIRAGHAPIEAALAALTDDELLAPAPGMDGWTRKDVVAHIAWWHEHSANVLEGVRTGADPYPGTDADWDTDDWNARVLADHRDLPAAQMRTMEAGSYARLVALVEAATDDELFGRDPWPWLTGTAAETVVADTSDHYPEHVPHLG